MAVYTVGRFQPPTLGHVRMIDAMLDIAKGKPAYVFISSAKDSLIPSAMKHELLTKMLTRNGSFPANLTLVDTAVCAVPCGGPLGGWGYLKDMGKVGPEVTLVVGGDQGPKFDPATAPMWKTVEPAERPSIVSIPRVGPGVATFSSTKARLALAESGIPGLTPFLKDAASSLTDADVERVGTELLKKKAKWKGGAVDDESAFDEDQSGGGHVDPEKWAQYIGHAKTLKEFQTRLGELKTQFGPKDESVWRPQYLAIKQSAATVFGMRVGQKAVLASNVAAAVTQALMLKKRGGTRRRRKTRRTKRSKASDTA